MGNLWKSAEVRASSPNLVGFEVAIHRSLPAEAISRRRVSLVLSLDANGLQRAPTMKAVNRASVKIRSVR